MERLQSLLTNFTDVMRASIQELEKAKDFPTYQLILNYNGNILAQKIITVGDFAAEQYALDNTPTKERFAYSLLLFDWMEKAKEFMVLWQDTLFQSQKAQVLYLDQRTSTTNTFHLKKLSTQSLHDASEDLLGTFEAKFQSLEVSEKMKPNLSKYEMQHSPYLIYREQIQLIIEHFKELEIQFVLLKSVSKSFDTIRTLIQETEIVYEKEMELLQQVATQIIAFIESHQTEQIGKITPFIKEQEDSLNSIDRSQTLIRNIENELGQLAENSKVFIKTDKSILLYKEINFQKDTRQWLETEILPVIYELRDLKENANQSLKMVFLNISNRIVLLSNQKQEDTLQSNAATDLRQPVQDFLDKLAQWEVQFFEQYNLLKKQLDTDLVVSSIYADTQNFLSTPLQATINQLRSHPNRWLDKIKYWWKQQRGIVDSIQRNNKQADALSASEKVVRIIEHRKAAIDSSYAGIFLTQGYIGEAFCAGREDEFLHIEQLIAAWQAGFRGTVLLSGQRFSGKTLFGEVVSNRYFPKQNIRLTPNSLLKVEGRQMTSDYNLGKSLDFIRKYTINKQVLIWIDDLELWNDQEFPLGKNVTVLCNYLEKYYAQFFFLVSMNNSLKKRLDDLHKIENKFQAEINLDQMPIKELQDAILIRHSATHKQLILADKKEINPKQFNKITSKIYRATEGNIGDALARWAFSTTEGEHNRILYTPKEQYALPEFVDADMAILLRALILEKRSNEYRLRKLFGELFKERYSPILQRLLGVGILTRHIDGWLEINPAIVNDIGRLLEEQQFLSFHHNK